MFYMKNNKKLLEKRYSQYYDNIEMYIKKYVVPEVYAYGLAGLYYKGLILDETLEQYVRSIASYFNVVLEFEDVRNDVEELLKIKYNLTIINDKPLIIDKYQ